MARHVNGDKQVVRCTTRSEGCPFGDFDTYEDATAYLRGLTDDSDLGTFLDLNADRSRAMRDYAEESRRNHEVSVGDDNPFGRSGRRWPCVVSSRRLRRGGPGSG